MVSADRGAGQRRQSLLSLLLVPWLLDACGEPSECPAPLQGSIDVSVAQLRVRPPVRAASAAVSASEPLDPERGAPLDELFAYAAQHFEFTSISASVITDDGATWSAGADATFYWASVGKAFTAAEIVRLARLGDLALDAPVSDFVSVSVHEDLTIDDLLTHTSGIYDFASRPGWYLHTEEYKRPLQLVDLAYGREARCPPSSHDYSNTNYVLLGLIIERVTGRAYHEAMTAGVLSRPPLRSLDVVAPEQVPPTVEMPVGEPPVELTTIFAAGAVVATTLEMALAWRGLFADESGGYMLDLVSVLRATESPSAFYGRGVLVALRSAGGVRIAHAGALGGSQAYVAWSSEKQATVAVAITLEIRDDRNYAVEMGRLLLRELPSVGAAE